MKRFSYTTILAPLLIACSNQNFNSENQNNANKIVQVNDSIDSRLNKNKSFKYNYTVQDKNGNRQVLSVNILSDDSLTYQFVYSGDLLEKSISVEGIVVLVPRNGDGESIVDEEGNFYFAEEYLSQGNDCPVTIRIDEDFQVAQFFGNKCINQLNHSQLDYSSVMSLMN